MADSTKFERWLSIVKSFVEIGAIFIGGWWAYDKFIKTEEPALRPHFQVSSELVWHKLPGSSNCIAEVKVDVQNKSKSNIDVRAVRRAAWSVAPEPETSMILYFDAMESTHANPLEDKIYETGPLVQSYPPEGSSHHTFTWFVRKQRGTYSLFRVELLKQANEKEPLDYIYEWGPTCDSVVTPSKPPRLK